MRPEVVRTSSTLAMNESSSSGRRLSSSIIFGPETTTSHLSAIATLYVPL